MLLCTSVMKVLCSVGMERTRPELVEALVAQLVLEAADICLENQLHLVLTYGKNRHRPEISGFKCVMGYINFSPTQWPVVVADKKTVLSVSLFHNPHHYSKKGLPRVLYFSVPNIYSAGLILGTQVSVYFS